MQNKDSQAITSTKEIAVMYDIPLELLAKTLQLMARGGIVDAVTWSQRWL